MENEQKQYELRSRSRSRSVTPQLLSSRSVHENEGSEHNYELRSRSRENSMTPGEVSSSRRSNSKSLPSSVIKVRNKNMDTITEQLDDTIVLLEPLVPETPNNRTQTTTTTMTSTTTSVSVRKSERRSERQKVKRQTLVNGQSEAANSKGGGDDSSDTKSETKERGGSLTPKRTITSDYSSEEGDREEVINRPGSAYEFYKQQGDYWNKFPKTDYTYSPTSTCRYEVAPGVMAIPNMSRRSLHSDGNNSYSQASTNSLSSEESNNTMEANDFARRGLTDAAGESLIYKRTAHLERYSTRREYVYNNNSARDNQINERYESWANPLLNAQTANRRFRSAAFVDSDAELDEAMTVSNRRYKDTTKRRFSSFTSSISTWFYAALHLITFNFFKKEQYISATASHYNYLRQHEETRWSRMRRGFDSLIQRLYLLLVKVLLFDSWLLSRASNVRERVQGRRSKILWLVLLPLALAFGCWFLPYLVSAIPLSVKSVLPQLKEEQPVVQSFAPYVERDVKANEELRSVIDLLISRVQRLEAAKSEQSRHLENVTQVLEEHKQTDGQIWKHYDEKLLTLEQVLEEQNNDREKCKSEELDYLKVELQTLKKLYSQLKTCCDTPSNTVSEEDIKKQADQVFAGYFGSDFSKENVVRIFQIMNSKIQQGDFEKSQTAAQPSGESGDNSNLGVDEIRRIVLSILKIYDADKTGRVDYALESAGGQIISTRCTQRYNVHTRAFKILGLTLYYESNNPRTVIQGNTLQPGMCWAFQDFPGYLLIKLRSSIYVTGFTIEHAPRANLPNGEMKSAPKKFNVWGLKAENDVEPVMFGEYTFLDSDESLQYFPVQNTSITTPYEFVELRIHSNHGQLEYTCLYRFRAHGNLA